MSKRRTEPVTTAGLIAGAVAGVIITIGGLARALGWVTDDLDVNAVARQASDLILGAGILWSTLAPAVLALWARSKVTPLADPRNHDGTPLVVDSWPVDELVTTNPADLVSADPGDPYLPDDDPGKHAAPELPDLPTTEIPAVTAPPPPVGKPTPIAAALLDDTQPAMTAVRS